MLEAAGEDVEQKSLQSRGEQTGEGFALFHGKGEGKDDREVERYKYLRDLSRALEEVLEGYDLPLVVASKEETFSEFREICSYKNIFPQFVSGNYDNEDIILVHEKANEVLFPYFDQVKREKKEKYLEAPGELINSKTAEVIKGAHAGQIEALFVERGKRLWGHYDEETGVLDIHEHKEPLDHCLMDYAARNTFLKQGAVFIENIDDMPESGSPLNAVLRFSVK